MRYLECSKATFLTYVEKGLWIPERPPSYYRVAAAMCIADIKLKNGSVAKAKIIIQDFYRASDIAEFRNKNKPTDESRNQRR